MTKDSESECDIFLKYRLIMQGMRKVFISGTITSFRNREAGKSRIMLFVANNCTNKPIIEVTIST